jgi:hypothetical protein
MNPKNLILWLTLATITPLHTALITHYQEEMTKYTHAMQEAQDVVDYLIYHPALSAQELATHINKLNQSFSAASQSFTILQNYYNTDKSRVQHRTEIQQKLGINKHYLANNNKALKELEKYLASQKKPSLTT